jgi:hypothetical protein
MFPQACAEPFDVIGPPGQDQRRSAIRNCPRDMPDDWSVSLRVAARIAFSAVL